MIAAPRSVILRPITIGEEFSQCRDQWNELAGDQIFSRWEWMYHWWSRLAGKPGLAIAVVVDRNGRWLGLAPWYRADSLTHGRTLRLLGDGTACSDYNSFLVRSGCETEVATALSRVMAGEVIEPEWTGIDLFEFEGHVSQDLAMQSLHPALESRGLRFVCEEVAASWRSALPENWHEYEARLCKSFRRKVRKANRRIQSPEFRAEVFSGSSDIEQNWESFARLHQARRQSLGEPGCFADPAFESFLRQATLSLADSGLARLNMIFHEGRPLGANLQFVARDSALMYQTGFDPNRLDLEPGHLTFAWAIQSAIRDRLGWFDFLRGDEMYKSRWRASRVPLFRTRVVPPRISARLREGVRNAGRHVGNLTRLLPWKLAQN